MAAMHPILDGNGRTARALEALMLQRVGLRDALFIAMSNFYYEHKTGYLTALADVRAAGHDLTPFLSFALQGVERQCRQLFHRIREEIVRALFRDTMTQLVSRLRSPRKRAMSERHVQVLHLLLDAEPMAWGDVIARTRHLYVVKNPLKALARDVACLLELKAVRFDSDLLSINLNWPAEITETEFFRLVQNMPKGKLGFAGYRGIRQS
jgi:hypothetical protein